MLDQQWRFGNDAKEIMYCIVAYFGDINQDQEDLY